jgi:hypothetical protein
MRLSSARSVHACRLFVTRPYNAKGRPLRQFCWPKLSNHSNARGVIFRPLPIRAAPSGPPSAGPANQAEPGPRPGHSIKPRLPSHASRPPETITEALFASGTGSHLPALRSSVTDSTSTTARITCPAGSGEDLLQRRSHRPLHGGGQTLPVTVIPLGHAW